MKSKLQMKVTKIWAVNEQNIKTSRSEEHLNKFLTLPIMGCVFILALYNPWHGGLGLSYWIF